MKWLISMLEFIVSRLKSGTYDRFLSGEDFPWISRAKSQLGQKEKPGAAHNPNILLYHAATTLHKDMAKLDETPWCASFVTWCLESSGMQSTRSAWSRSYLSYGTKLAKPKYGCVAVLTRDGGGHVGFYLGETETHVILLGGNQDDAVNVSGYDKARVLGYVWPVEKKVNV